MGCTNLGGKTQSKQATEPKQEVKPSEPIKKDTARQSDLIGYINKQVGVDLNKYRDDTTRKFDRRDGISIDWDSVPKNDRQKILDLANRYGGDRYSVEDNGAWMKFIRIKKKK